MFEALFASSVNPINGIAPFYSEEQVPLRKWHDVCLLIERVDHKVPRDTNRVVLKRFKSLLFCDDFLFAFICQPTNVCLR